MLEKEKLKARPITKKKRILLTITLDPKLDYIRSTVKIIYKNMFGISIMYPRQNVRYAVFNKIVILTTGLLYFPVLWVMVERFANEAENLR